MRERVLTDGWIRLRPATADDLPFILAAEADARSQGFVAGWSQDQHRDALGSEGTAYRVIETGAGSAVGYAILQSAGHPNGSVELTRIVVTERGRGYGRRALRLLKRLAFDVLGAHRLWLDVFEHNERARHLYVSEGFVAEGVLRECIRTPSGFASLVVMSLLDREYRASRDGSAP